MAKRKKKKGIIASFFGLGSGRTTKAHLERRKLMWFGTLKFLILFIVIAAIGTGLFFLEKYVVSSKQLGEKWLPLELVDAPDWLSEDLRHKIYETAGNVKGYFLYDDDTASVIVYNLRNLAWLHNIKVKTDGNKIRLYAGYYQPLVLIENGERKVFLAADRGLEYEDFELIVLDYVPVYDLPIMMLKGVKTRTMQSAGCVWDKTDAHSAVELVRLLTLMDEKLLKKSENENGDSVKFKPLLKELSSVDVSNFNGRKNAKKPHIVLNSLDGTAIYWGALEGGLEAEKAEKLGKLYQYYEDYGTLQAVSSGQARYIDLRIATKSLPIP